MKIPQSTFMKIIQLHFGMADIYAITEYKAYLSEPDYPTQNSRGRWLKVANDIAQEEKKLLIKQAMEL